MTPVQFKLGEYWVMKIVGPVDVVVVVGISLTQLAKTISDGFEEAHWPIWNGWASRGLPEHWALPKSWRAPLVESQVLLM
jgi:hypothetical protein